MTSITIVFDTIDGKQECYINKDALFPTKDELFKRAELEHRLKGMYPRMEGLRKADRVSNSKTFSETHRTRAVLAVSEDKVLRFGSPKDCAKAFGVGVNDIYRWVHRGTKKGDFTFDYIEEDDDGND